MKKFIGVKLINAIPMSRLDYNIFRGWDLPENENGEDAGYLVEYIDGGTANTPQYEGYVSWSPTDVFDKAYRAIDGLTFGLAVEALKLGKKVARDGWNGKGMWLNLVRFSGLAGGLIEGEECFEYAPYIQMKTADNKLVPWLASQTDVLAEDWLILD